jgi:hypothetical protein
VSSDTFDFSDASGWRGLHPGMSRADVLRIFDGAGCEVSLDEGDPHWAMAPGWGMELRFDEAAPMPLLQVAVDLPVWTWARRALLGQTVRGALGIVGAAGEGARWRGENAVEYFPDDCAPTNAGDFADEALLAAGTLWLPARRLGLVFDLGRVQTVVWRHPEWVPDSFAGAVTPPQLALGDRADLADYLRTWRPKRRRPALESMVHGVFTLGLIFIGLHAWREQQAWKSAPAAMAKVVAIEPAGARPGQRTYVVKFTDAGGNSGQAALAGHDFFVPPGAVGELVEVRWLPGEPPQVKGPARAGEAGLATAMPQVIGLLAAYLLAISIAAFLARMRQLKASAWG